MTIDELLQTDEWIDVEHTHVVVKDIGGTVYYDGGDLQVDPFDYDEHPTPEWACRPILMQHHIVGDHGIDGLEDEVVVTIV